MGLHCMTCKAPYQEDGQEYVCKICGGSIEPDGVPYPEEHLRDILKTGSSQGIWGYRTLLSLPPEVPCITLGEGNTPLLKASHLEKLFGVQNIYLKNETLNPSGSYKDRFAALAVAHARERGVKALALGSAGNAAGAVSAYAAKARIPCFVLLPTDAVKERAWQIQAYGANMIGMDCTIAECIHYVQEGSRVFGWENVSTTMKYHPYASEGYKTIAYEMARQMDFEVPDWILCPVGGASLINKIYKGYEEMYSLGLISRIPRFGGIQAAGCAPLVQAYEEGASATSLWPEPHTVAFAIADTETFEGVTALDVIRRTNGVAASVTDQEIMNGLHLLASSEAVVAEPASASVVAALYKLLMKKVIAPGDSVACIISGSGLKDLSMVGASLPPNPVISGCKGDCDQDAVIKKIREIIENIKGGESDR